MEYQEINNESDTPNTVEETTNVESFDATEADTLSESTESTTSEQENAMMAVESIVEQVQTGVDTGEEVKTITAMMNSAGMKTHTTTTNTVGDFLREQGVNIETALVSAIPHYSTGAPQIASFVQNFDEPLNQDLIYNIASRNVTGG